MKIQIENKVIISDPCYTRNNEYMSEQDNMLEGEYKCYIEESDELGWGIRVKSIEIVHSDYERPTEWQFKNDNIGVDSGQCGIFCDSIYPQGETGEYGDMDTFYGKCCELTSQNGEEVENYCALVRDIKITKSLKEDEFAHNRVVWNRDYHKEYVDALESLETYLSFEKKRCDSLPTRKNEKYIWENYIEDFTDDFYRLTKSQWHHKLYKLYNDYLTTNQLPEEPKLIQFGIIDDKGIVAHSGFGDGIYECFANFNKEEKCIGIKVRFI